MSDSLTSVQNEFKISRKLEIMSNKVRKITERVSNLVLMINSLNECLKRYKLPELSYEESLQKANSNIHHIVFLPKQSFILKELSQEICSVLPFHDYVIQGFIKRGIKKWQTDNNQPFMTLTRMNPVERLQAISEILGYATTLMSRALYQPNRKLKEIIIRNAFNIAIDYYEELISVSNMHDNHAFEDVLVDTADSI
jgi:hypothetical protein